MHTVLHNKKETGPALYWAGLFVCCTVAWSFHLVSFLHAKDLVLALGLPVAAVWQYRAGRFSLEGFCRLGPLWLGVLFWCLSGLFTARVPSYLVENVIRWVMLLSSAALMLEAFRFRNGRLWLYRAFLLSGAVIGALALLQYAGLAEGFLPRFPGYDQRAYSVFGNQDLLGGYMAFNLVLLLSLFLRDRRNAPRIVAAYIGVFALLLGALIVSSSRSAWLATAAGIGCAVLLPGGWLRLRRIVNRRRRALLLLALVGATLLATGAPQIYNRAAASLSVSDVGGRARLWFWAGAAQMIREHPWTGVGLGQYGYWSPSCQGQVLWRPGGERFFFNELHTEHAHSEPLDWLAETGAAGALFWLAFFVWTFKRRNPALPALVVLAVFACFNSFSHSTPHVLAVLLPAALARPVPRCGETMPKVIGACCALLAPVAFVLVVIVPSALLCRAEQAHVAGQVRDSLYQNTFRWPWPNYRAHENYGLALLDSDFYDEAAAHLESALNGQDTGHVYYLLTLCAVSRQDDEAALFYAGKCLLRWPGNEYAWSALLERCPPGEVPDWKREKQRFTGRAEYPAFSRGFIGALREML